MMIQGDPISPKLFTLALENVFEKLQWDDKGITIDGTKRYHLRFAEDVGLISSDQEELKAVATYGLKTMLTQRSACQQTADDA